MILDKQDVKRLGIFFFYDRDGIADRYVEYLVTEFKKSQDYLITVSNGELSEDAHKMFSSCSDNVIVRENKGLDVGAYLAALRSLGWNELEKYDEITIMNFTLMGPVYPLIDMYNDMAMEDVDFWGISKHFKFDHDLLGNIPYGYLPEHIQSHFMVFRSSLVKSKEFQDFWDNMPKIENYKDSVAMFEATFTKRFSDYGFKWKVYSSVDDMEGVSYNPIMEYPTELVKNRKCSLFKRRSFFQEQDVVLDTTMGEAVSDLFNYLEKESDYDTGLIWENIIRTCNHADFAKALNLNYVLSTKVVENNRSHAYKIVIVMHLRNQEQLTRSIHYANQLPNDIDIKVLVRSEELDYYKTHFVITKGNSIEFIECQKESDADCFMEIADRIKDYDIGCYYHDACGNVVKNSFYYKNTENLLYNDMYIQNVIQTFAENAYLGLLVPPTPNHSQYISMYGREWHGYYQESESVVKTLGIDVPISDKKEPIAPFGNMFWFRIDALVPKMQQLQQLKKDYETERFPHIWKRVLPFICLKNGFYPAYVLTDYCSRMELTNFNYYMREYGRFFERNGVCDGTQKELIRHLEAKCHGHQAVPLSTPFHMKFAHAMQKLLPKGLYDKLIYIKRRIFGPYDLL